jgi:hypothetical protein
MDASVAGIGINTYSSPGLYGGKVMRAILTIAVTCMAAALTGCASTPDVSVYYYLPHTDLTVHVVRTVACDANQLVVSADSVTATPSHSADTSVRYEIPLRELDGFLSDTDFKIDLTNDGRLKGLNASTTGEAEPTIKQLVTLVSAVAGAAKTTKAKNPSGCAAVSDANKPPTVAFSRTLDFTRFTTKQPDNSYLQVDTQELAVDRDYAAVYETVKPAVGQVCARITKLVTVNSLKPPPYGPAFERAKDPDRFAELSLRQPALVGLTLFSPANDALCDNASAEDVADAFWTGQIEVAQLGVPYQLPIPKARLFGKLQFNLSVAESGAVTSLQYTKTAGVTSALSSANTTFSATQPETAAQQAADLKAQSDLIVQQQRLVKCQINPKNCT